MKSAFLVLSTLVSLSAWSNGAKPSLCGVTMECGTFSGYSESDKEKVELMTLTIADAGSNTLSFEYKVEAKGEEPLILPLTLKFGDSGSFEVIREGQVWAVGLCKEKLCSYAMRPWNHEGMRTHTGMIQFIDGQLKFRMMWGTPARFDSDVTVLEKRERSL